VISQYIEVIEKAFAKYLVDKAVIYCNTVNIIKNLAKVLNCWAFYHDVKKKIQILQWFCIERQMMVVTSAFSMKIDIADIWLIIYIGWLCTLLNYAQKSGHAEQDRLKSEVVVMIWQSQFMKADQELKDWLVWLFVKEAECKCWILNEYLNGWRVQIEYEKEKIKCKVCQNERQVDMQETMVMKHEEKEKQKKVSSEEERNKDVEELKVV